MAISSLLPLGLCLFLVFNGCFAQIEQVTSRRDQPLHQHRLQFRRECSLRDLNAQEPSRQVEAEAGFSEFWDETEEQFECAGVAAERHTVNPRGLFLPSFVNAPKLVYIVQGKAVHGAVIPGCPETYQSSEQEFSGDFRRPHRHSQSQNPQDEHQKIRNVREGDIIALLPGVANWFYNNGNDKLVFVSVVYTAQAENQLDQNPRKFFLAGNRQAGQERRSSRRQSRMQSQSQQEGFGNIFNGFEDQILAEAFQVETELARKLQGENDQRGHIVEVQGHELEFLSPRHSREEQRSIRDNGLEETLCTLRLKENIGDASRADVYNPHGGRITTLNSLNLPILRFLQLSAEKGVLYRNGMLSPHWNLNSHSVMYVTRGSARIQISGENGDNVFDDEVNEGQFLVIPQNFAVVKRAGSEGFEWIAIKTNDNAITSRLAGKMSAIRSLPEEVLMNSFQISREDARDLKQNREEMTVFSPQQRSERRD
jgi:mannose-6-phosphate isomerase-like protein (cupin superfamily)